MTNDVLKSVCLQNINRYLFDCNSGKFKILRLIVLHGNCFQKVFLELFCLFFRIELLANVLALVLNLKHLLDLDQNMKQLALSNKTKMFRGHK
jgi:hypothetical protein